MRGAVLSVAGIVTALLMGSLLAAAGSQDSIRLAGVPLFALCAGVAFAIQWLAFLPAWIFHTERYYDLTGSLTYILLTLLLLVMSDASARNLLIAGMVLVWAARLGSFLFLRVSRAGEDRRFRGIRDDFLRFLMTWTLQGLWVFVTYSAGIAAMTAIVQPPLGIQAWVGGAMWLLGFGLEVVADRQKSRFRDDPANADRFVTRGLWSWSRHPNYFGEMLLWTGIAVIALPALTGWRYVTLVSPIFVVLLITFVSGVRMLEARAERKWGNDPDYVAYKRRTSLLLPLPPKR